MFSFFVLLLFLSTSLAALEKNVLMSEVFEIIIDPPMFNWTYEGNKYLQYTIYYNFNNCSYFLITQNILFCLIITI